MSQSENWCSCSFYFVFRSLCALISAMDHAQSSLSCKGLQLPVECVECACQWILSKPFVIGTFLCYTLPVDRPDKITQRSWDMCFLIAIGQTCYRWKKMSAFAPRHYGPPLSNKCTAESSPYTQFHAQLLVLQCGHERMAWANLMPGLTLCTQQVWNHRGPVL